jgi:peroxiredoxin
MGKLFLKETSSSTCVPLKTKIIYAMIVIDPKILAIMITQNDETVLNIANVKPTMLIFLRHFGCPFCRKAMDDLSKLRPRLASLNTELVLVHMAENNIADTYFRKFKLVGVSHVSDPDCRFYTAFGLKKGSLTQIFGFQSWIRGFVVQSKYGAEVNKQLGDNFQMSGAFMLFEGNVIDSYVHKNTFDRPNYEDMINSISLN